MKLLIITVLLGAPLFAKEAQKIKKADEWNIRMVQGSLAILNSTSSSSENSGNGERSGIYGELLWNPEYTFTPTYSFRAILGGGFANTYKDTTVNNESIGLNPTTRVVKERRGLFLYKAAALFAWTPTFAYGFGIEAGPGLQQWFFYNSDIPSETYLAGYANIYYYPKFLGLPFVDRVHAGIEYSNLNTGAYRALKLATVFVF